MAKRKKSTRVKDATATKPFFLHMDARLKKLSEKCFIGTLKLDASAAILMYCRLDRVGQVKAIDEYIAYAAQGKS